MPLIAELFQLAVHRETGPLLGDEQAHALVPRLGVRVGLDQKGEAVAVEAVGDPGLAAIDHVLIAGALRRGSYRLQVGAAVRLGQAHAAAQLAGREARQQRRLLLLGAVALHHHGHDQVRVDDAADRHPHRRDALDDLRVGRGRQAEAAVLGGDDAAEQPHLLHLFDDVRGVDVVMLEGVDVRLDLRASKTCRPCRERDARSRRFRPCR